MTIEEEIFKKSKIQFDTLIPYGFKKEKNKYVFSKNIRNDTFQVHVEISDTGEIVGTIYDLAFQEEYTNYRIENQIGEFASQVKEEFQNILIDIKNHCTTTNYFYTKQANRITNQIIQRYHDVPEFLWEKSPEHGVFRNPLHGKWYALIMRISLNKIDCNEGEKDVEILNLKLDEEEIPKLLKRKGFYPAYHMNKKSWITILLDHTVADEEIMNYIVKSHQFTEQAKEWLLPANIKYYDIIHCFQNTDCCLWKQPRSIQVGDIVYLYVGAPYSCILYQCKVLEINIPYSYQDKNLSIEKAMKIKLCKKYDEHQFSLQNIKKYGLNSVRGPRFIPKRLSELLKEDN